MKVEKVTAENLNEVVVFLEKHEETSIFLCGNLCEHGPHLTSHVNSGNFKLIKQDGKVICVFCLARRGPLLVQTDILNPIFETLVTSCREESFPLRGIIADWTFANPFWQYLKVHGVIQKETFHSKEICYSLSLDNSPTDIRKEASSLRLEDYDQWKMLREIYLKEQELPQDLSPKEVQDEFSRKARKGIIWGCFQDSQLISIGELNAVTEHAAVVGGVFTRKEWRRQGYGIAMMRRLIADCKQNLNLRKLIIFTGEEENKPAQRLYEALGCRPIGHMALLFGEHLPLSKTTL